MRFKPRPAGRFFGGYLLPLPVQASQKGAPQTMTNISLMSVPAGALKQKARTIANPGFCAQLGLRVYLVAELRSRTEYLLVMSQADCRLPRLRNSWRRGRFTQQACAVLFSSYLTRPAIGIRTLKDEQSRNASPIQELYYTDFNICQRFKISALGATFAAWESLMKAKGNDL